MGAPLTLQMPRAASFNFTQRLQFGNPFPSFWGVVGRLGRCHGGVAQERARFKRALEAYQRGCSSEVAPAAPLNG
ncbi:hypothetical protein BHS06_24705 [Myxococcus xanthus]|uniref:hypothetical protein n=1 Tax=Myxococcus xanthus TaxID=34 RepID=UPI001128867B|nr:hypothetical protein [Myxococcus xanthus]QDE91923.1 hypothetical protein BHS06_24705 [Myxococcus xanthus]